MRKHQFTESNRRRISRQQNQRLWRKKMRLIQKDIHTLLSSIDADI